MPQTNGEGHEGDSTRPASPGFGPDFARIPIHPPTAGRQRELETNERGNGHEQYADRLIAHEFAHSLQQRRGGPVPGMAWSPSERGADAVASSISAGRPVPEVLGATAVGIARQPTYGNLPRDLPESTRDHVPLQRNADGTATATEGRPLDQSIAERIEASRRGGAPLPDSVRGPLQQQLGVDLSPVRVHTDVTADGLSEDVQAEAFTVGSDIFFRSGSFQPGAAAGQRLIAHEAVHVAQQGAGGIARAVTVSDPTDPSETVAYRLAPQLAAGIARSAGNRALAQATQPVGLAGTPGVVQRDGPQVTVPKESPRELPWWVRSTPMYALEGVRVPGYEKDPEKYTEDDRSRMLDALNARVQVNGRRLADFYHDLRMAWIDLVIELGVDDAGLGLGPQTILGIIGNLIASPLGPTSGVIVGVIGDGIINIADEVKQDRDREKLKRELKEMMVAPEVANVGEDDANGKLAQLLLDAVAYTAWLQSASLVDLSKFRIPPQFPKVPEADIRFEVANAVIKWRSEQWGHYQSGFGYIGSGGGGTMFVTPDDVSRWTKELIKVNPASPPPNVVLVSMAVGRESSPHVSMNTHSALYKSIEGRKVGDLTGVTVLATYGGFPDVPFWHRPGHEQGFMGDDPRAVAFGRNEDGEVIIAGDFISLKHMHDAASIETHEEDAAASLRASVAPGYDPTSDTSNLYLSEAALKPHYKDYAVRYAKELLRKYVDPYVLPKRK